MKTSWFAASLFGIVLLAPGCSSKSSGGSGNTNAGTGPSGTLEIFSWWTAGGEQDGFLALKEVFSDKYPKVNVVNSTVQGGGGTDARATLAQRLAANNPPGSFQVHAGRELIDPLVTTGKMEPLTTLFAEQKWTSAMPSSLIDILSYGGDIWSVPVNIHRANVLWYNKSLFAQHQLKAPASWEDFFAAAAVLKAAGITPLALGGKSWTQLHLLETVLLGTLGAEAYRGLWTGTTAWNDAKVTTALENFKRVLDYTSSDFKTADRDWNNAAQLLIDGTAAMTIMGDWAEGYFKAAGWTPNVDFGWAATPGSAGAFDALSDSFGLPKGAPNRDAVMAWLTVCGSKAGQDAFNPLKGSIPARTDADRSLYDEYLMSAIDDFSRDTIVPSLTHGAAAKPAWSAAIGTAFDTFISDRKVPTLQSALVAACTDVGTCH